MKYKTTAFGDIDVKDSDIIVFSEGLLGFPDLKKYVFLKHPELEHVKWLQSLENEYIHFLLLSPFTVDPNYEIIMDIDLKKELECPDASHIAIFCIASVPENTKHSTINLKAPVLINFLKCLGKQIIVEKDDYSTKKPIWGDTE